MVTLLAAAPLITPAQTAPRSELLKGPSGGQQTELGSTNGEIESSDDESIRGFMTLEEVANQTGVPISDILERLDLPLNTAPSKQVGRLLRAHGMEMSNLRQVVGQDESGQ
ncbi:hypothetical protein [Bythopirellula polymerisocia]|uniref:Uncharacterized protein n=1 Tax=Bythopirellula polymerisocia TaxID=2528003 RepID=A0A5C6D042_9BACT|nr:hypothetical protein [Bythopirellula polymerisocia]TWU30483.1 hypothetical protein Pla144_12700 [Bythopirellula polymerisocia]